MRALLAAALLATTSSETRHVDVQAEVRAGFDVQAEVRADVVPSLTGLKVAAAGAPPIALPLSPPFNPALRAYDTSVTMSTMNVSVLPTATCAGCLIDVCINITKKMRIKTGVASTNVTIPMKVGTNLTVMVTVPWANNSGFSYANYSVNITKIADPPPPPAPPPPPPPP